MTATQAFVGSMETLLDSIEVGLAQLSAEGNPHVRQIRFAIQAGQISIANVLLNRCWATDLDAGVSIQALLHPGQERQIEAQMNCVYQKLAVRIRRLEAEHHKYA